MTKILEILDKKQIEIIRTGSLWDWNEGYPESQFELLCRLENGSFFEDENKITFYTTENEEIGLEKRGFLVVRTSEKVVYNAPLQLRITKNIIEMDIFEITDRVGNYIKIRVEPMFNIPPLVRKKYRYDYKYLRLNGQKLSMLYLALSKGLFQRPEKGQIYFENSNDGSSILYFKSDYYISLTDSIFRASYQGEFAKSNSESDWNDLKNTIDQAEISDKENVENLKLYGVYDK